MYERRMLRILPLLCCHSVKSFFSRAIFLFLFLYSFFARASFFLNFEQKNLLENPAKKTQNRSGERDFEGMRFLISLSLSLKTLFYFAL